MCLKLNWWEATFNPPKPHFLVLEEHLKCVALARDSMLPLLVTERGLWEPSHTWSVMCEVPEKPQPSYLSFPLQNQAKFYINNFCILSTLFLLTLLISWFLSNARKVARKKKNKKETDKMKENSWDGRSEYKGQELQNYWTLISDGSLIMTGCL